MQSLAFALESSREILVACCEGCLDPPTAMTATLLPVDPWAGYGYIKSHRAERVLPLRACKRSPSGTFITGAAGAAGAACGGDMNSGRARVLAGVLAPLGLDLAARPSCK